MDLRRQGQVVRTWLWLLIAGVLLAGGSAYLVSVALPKVYEAQATLLVGESSSSSGININDLLASQRISQTYADLATTGTILGQVMANAGRARDLMSSSPDALVGLIRPPGRSVVPVHR